MAWRRRSAIVWLRGGVLPFSVTFVWSRPSGPCKSMRNDKSCQVCMAWDQSVVGWSSEGWVRFCQLSLKARISPGQRVGPSFPSDSSDSASVHDMAQSVQSRHRPAKRCPVAAFIRTIRTIPTWMGSSASRREGGVGARARRGSGAPLGHGCASCGRLIMRSTPAARAPISGCSSGVRTGRGPAFSESPVRPAAYRPACRMRKCRPFLHW